MPDRRSVGARGVERALFLAAFIAYAYFHQGGGWSQNARFAMIRAIVERGTFAVDDVLVYRVARDAPSGSEIRGVPISAGEFEVEGRRVVAAWSGAGGRMAPVNPASTAPMHRVPIGQLGASGDLVFARGHFHPNKAPGAALLGVPAYAALLAVDRVLGVDPDAWWTLTVNAWLTGALSVGLIAALGVVLFRRLALDLAAGREGPAWLATVAFAFGTMYFPYATTLYEHDVVAAGLLVAFYLIHTARERAITSAMNPRLVLAGLCAGWAAITNYVTAAIVVLLAAYLAAPARSRRGLLGFAVGVAVPLVVVCSYHWACFGTPFTTNYQHQNPMFRSAGAAMGVFLAPNPSVLVQILVSPFRGLFVSSPVLAAGAWGIVLLARDPARRAAAAVITAIVLFFVLFTTSFNLWEGGNGVGPRYLAPAVPFLALPVAVAATRAFRIVAVLAAVSVVLGLLVTTVDPQVPVVRVEGRPLWRSSPLTEYVIPLFATGRPGPLVDAMVEGELNQADREMAASGVPTAERGTRIAAMREILERRLGAPDGGGVPVAAFRGPVSVNPMGMYEGWYWRAFPPGSPEARWNSFNAGELLFPERRLSLAPLLAASGGLLAFAVGRSRRTAS